ncbi:cytochrome P450 [Fomes fomentarius]|nr:cytochrome P450 [Fomes fomentarius]
MHGFSYGRSDAARLPLCILPVFHPHAAGVVIMGMDGHLGHTYYLHGSHAYHHRVLFAPIALDVLYLGMYSHVLSATSSLVRCSRAIPTANMSALDYHSTWLCFVFIFSVAWKYNRASTPPTGMLPLPPGPRPLPIVGNFFDTPTKDMEHAFYELNKRYGDIVYLNTFGQSMIVLGTHEAALDLLEKRSSNYSDRLDSVMVSLTGLGWIFTTLPYGARWRRTRRLFHEYMHPNAILKYRPIQQRLTLRYLRWLLDDPEDFQHHGRHLFGASIIRIGYGIDIEKSDIDYLGIAEEALNKFSQVFVPGKYLVETFPSLCFLPAWFPGAKFKRQAAEWFPLIRNMRDIPWAAAVAAVKEGRCMPCMATSLMERMSHLKGEAAKEEEEHVKDAIASAYAGESLLSSTLSTLQTFYLAMASYPEVQARAQDELDAVIGPHRLPTHDDSPDLPYVNAVIKECLRWRPVVPLNVVHLSVAEDEYQGYRIPAKTAIVNSPWAYVRDPKVYPDPETFNPERFLKDGKLDPNVQNPSNIVFGFGRRICPGRHFAEAVLFITISSVLQTLSIEPPLNQDGKPIRLSDTVKMSPGLISYPEPFPCVVKPRSQAMEALIRANANEYENDVPDLNQV